MDCPMRKRGFPHSPVNCTPADGGKHTRILPRHIEMDIIHIRVWTYHNQKDSNTLSQTAAAWTIARLPWLHIRFTSLAHPRHTGAGTYVSKQPHVVTVLVLVTSARLLPWWERSPFKCWTRIYIESKLCHHLTSRCPSTSWCKVIIMHGDEYIFCTFLSKTHWFSMIVLNFVRLDYVIQKAGEMLRLLHV